MITPFVPVTRAWRYCPECDALPTERKKCLNCGAETLPDAALPRKVDDDD